MPKAFFKIFEQYDIKFLTDMKCDLVPVVFIKQPLQKFNLKVIVSTHLNVTYLKALELSVMASGTQKTLQLV